METLQEYLEKQANYYEKLMIKYGNEFGRKAEELQKLQAEVTSLEYYYNEFGRKAEELQKLQAEVTSLEYYYNEYRGELKKFEVMLEEYEFKNK